MQREECSSQQPKQKTRVTQITNKKKLATKYTFTTDSKIYVVQHFIYSMACLYTTIVYPYFSINDITDY